MPTEIVDNRQLFARGDLDDAGDKIFAAINDRVIAPVSLDQCCLFIIAHGADDSGAEMLCPLAHDQPDTAGRGMDQDRLARFDLMGAADQIPGGHALQHHRRCLLIGDAGRERHQPIGRHDPRFGIGSDRAAGIGDAVARFQVADTRSNLFDDPAASEPSPLGIGSE